MVTQTGDAALHVLGLRPSLSSYPFFTLLRFCLAAPDTPAMLKVSFTDGLPVRVQNTDDGTGMPSLLLSEDVHCL